MSCARVITSRAWLLSLALALWSCTFEDKRPECSVSADCSSGQSCYKGFCYLEPASNQTPGTDAGAADAAAHGGGRGAAGAGAGGKGRAGTGGSAAGAGGQKAVAGAPAGPCTGPAACTVAAADVDRFNGCGEGQRECVDGKLGECMPTHTRTNEVCNGVDDDCDSKVDEAADVEPCYPSGTKGCSEEVPGKFVCSGICKAGKRSCINGVAGECVGAVMPMAMEVCGGLVPQDDDCNGTVDDTCKCTNADPLPCYEGDPAELFAGSECKEGTQACVAGVLGLCLNQRRKMAETCANPGHDDDCNKIVDDIPNLNAACSVSGMKGLCSAGKMMCMGATLTCVATVTPTTEVCNDMDDDCDGVVDQTFDKLTDRSHCGTCNHACAATETCKAGVCTATSGTGEDAGT